MGNRVLYFLQPNKRKLAGEFFKDIPTYVINLESRPDRLAKTKKTLARMQFNSPIRIPGVWDEYPKRGCSKAHLNTYTIIRDSKYDVALICEDDIKFVGNLSVLMSAVVEFLKDESLKVFCVASLPKNKEDIGKKYLLRTTNVQTASCYLVKRAILDDLIEIANSSIESLTESQGKTVPIDKEWKKLQIGNRFVVSKRRLCVQRVGYSDIEKRQTWYNY
jgi:GR25 family glycosyltransferase involved in LPS biosynthesis